MHSMYPPNNDIRELEEAYTQFIEEIANTQKVNDYYEKLIAYRYSIRWAVSGSTKAKVAADLNMTATAFGQVYNILLAVDSTGERLPGINIPKDS